MSHHWRFHINVSLHKGSHKRCIPRLIKTGFHRRGISCQPTEDFTRTRPSTKDLTKEASHVTPREGITQWPPISHHQRFHKGKYPMSHHYMISQEGHSHVSPLMSIASVAVVRSIVRSFIPFFVRSFIRSLVRLFLCSFARSFVVSFLCSFVSFVRLFVRSLARSCVCFFVL